MVAQNLTEAAKPYWNEFRPLLVAYFASAGLCILFRNKIARRNGLLIYLATAMVLIYFLGGFGLPYSLEFTVREVIETVMGLAFFGALARLGYELRHD
jgi:hypothetical protein